MNLWQLSIPSPERLAELRAMSYEHYLLSPEWRRKRQLVLKIYQNRCALCNSPNNLEIHHRTYWKNGESQVGREKLSDLVCLCQECHDLADHQRRRRLLSV